MTCSNLSLILVSLNWPVAIATGVTLCLLVKIASMVHYLDHRSDCGVLDTSTGGHHLQVCDL